MISINTLSKSKKRLGRRKTSADESSVKDGTERINKREIWAVDSETDPFKKRRIPKPFVWGAYNGSEYHEFAHSRGLVDFLSIRDCIVYAHNGGRFDWHYLLEYLEPYTDVLVIAGRMAKFKIGDAEFRDSYNLLPMPLRAGGRKLEIDYDILEVENRDIPKNREIIKERLRTDCVYLWEMLQTFIRDYGFHLTFPGASMSAWSKLSGIKTPETSSAFYKAFEPYYFGGRVECFETGIVERPLKLFDINSAYSFAMLSNHPYGETIHEERTLPNSRAAIERCFISVECRSRGAFPIRDDSGGISFPADGRTRLHHVTGWEYLAARETGCLDEYGIDRVLSLPNGINFVGYMENFYKVKVDAKKRNDVFAYECAKRFLCSLYGKFGSNPENYFEYRLVPPRMLDMAYEADGFMFCAEVGKDLCLCARPLSENKQRFYNVAVAASITGFVRAYLYRAIRSARGVIYCDTDCLVCSDYSGISTDDTALGAWKFEGNINYAAIAGKKLYALRMADGQWKTASKGVRLTAAEIVRIAQGEVIEYEPEVPQYSFKKGIRFVNRKIQKTG